MKIFDIISILAFSLLWFLFFQKREGMREMLLGLGSETFWILMPILLFILVTLLTRFIKNKYL